MMQKYKHIILLLLIFISSVHISAGQDNSVDDKQLIGNSKAAELIVKGRELINTNPDQTLDIALQALVVAKKNKDLIAEAAALELLGDASYNIKEFDAALKYYYRAFSILVSNKKDNLAVRVLLSIAKVHETTNNPDLAIQQVEAGIKQLGGSKNSPRYLDLIIKLANLYLVHQNPKLASKYGLEAQSILNSGTSEIPGKERYFLQVYELLGQSYKNSGNLNLSLDYFKKLSENAIKLSDSTTLSKSLSEVGVVFMLTNKPDSALQYFSLAYTVSLNASDSAGIVKSLFGLGDYNFDVENYNQALNYYSQCNEIAQKINDIETSLAALVKISRCYSQLGDYPTSSKFLNRALAIAQKHKLTSSKADVYKYLSVLNEAQGRYKDALEYHKMWVELRDSIYFEETGQKLAKLQILYEITQKEKENEILKQNAEIQKLQIARSRYQFRIMILILVAVAIMLILLIVLFRNKQKEIIKQKETEQRITQLNKALERRMIEEIKKQEKQQQLLAQKSKLESLGTLAAGIAHEINQPLGGISMGLDNILMRLSDKSYSEEYLKEKLSSLFENVERIKKIIDHIRYFSRTQKPVAFTSVNLNDVVNSALFMVTTQFENHGIEVQKSLDENLPFITADKYKLEQVLLNLLSNAKYALDDKAKKTTESNYRKRIKINTWQDRDNIYLSVWDNGTGIPKNYVEKIFDPFFTTKSEEKGTGLGLSISYGFIKDLLGDIRVESEPGEYTLFEISIPKEK
ncbi:tetratricopeptide repeat protein [Tenuifilum thalassicum]|uniref:histidine kinase n=1 Tax=Tenuifilum thalassicum TaxID=2590900 RepID=A0A7D3Y3X8_9BACT|nr:tetratricopeptide repeat protein [Tenuifilum thalassicum]QKG79629.1 tetratricopeptide repeat protein [Tenuifilum thalassicum]